eukprot:1195200-Prorocentrum_minimum.AAC.3
MRNVTSLFTSQRDPRRRKPRAHGPSYWAAGRTSLRASLRGVVGLLPATLDHPYLPPTDPLPTPCRPPTLPPPDTIRRERALGVPTIYSQILKIHTIYSQGCTHLVAHRAAVIGGVDFVIGSPQHHVPGELRVAHHVTGVVRLAVLLATPANQPLVI